MDLDAFVAAHQPEWDRLRQLARRRPRRLSGAEVDELVMLYQRAATHLAVVSARAPDPVLVSRLSALVALGRSAVTGSEATTREQIKRFLVVTFPVAAWRVRWWFLASALGSIAVAVALGVWVVHSPSVQRELLPADQVRQLVNTDFADYYRSHPAHDFATQVWTNNAYVAAVCLAGGILFGLPPLVSLVANMANVGVEGGYLVAAGHGAQFFGLILPHGILELSCVFLAAAAGLRLGWTLIDPGPLPRAEALAREGRSTVTIAIGLTGVLAVSGVLEAFLTPSGLPTWLRVGIGAAVAAGFYGYVVFYGRRAERAGETGDLDESARGDTVPVAV